MVLRLIDDDEIRYNKKKYEIKCRLCKNDDTKILSNGEPIWIKDNDIRGDWTGQFLCYNCYYDDDKVCYKCGAEQITKSVQMYRHYYKGVWIGKYICRDCHRKDRIDYRNRNISFKIKEGGGSLLDTVVSTVLDVPTYSIYIADKRLPFGIIHERYGIIGIKASQLKCNNWYYNINDYISADTYFLMGFNEKIADIQIVYIIPSKERENIGRITINPNSKKYKEYRTDPESYNKIFKYLVKKSNKK